MKSDKKHIVLRAMHEMRAMGDGTCQPLNERIVKEIGLEHYLNALGFYAVKDNEQKDIILAEKYKVMKHQNHNHRLYLDIHTNKYYSLDKVRL